MAEQFTGDFHVVGTVDGSAPLNREFDVEAGAASTIAAGDLVTVGNAGYVAKAADGAASTVVWYGLALNASTDTAGADGVVTVAYSPSGLIVRGAPTTPGNLAQAIKYTKVTLDVAAGVQTVDENDTSNGILSVYAYDATTGAETIDVVVPYTVIT